MIFLLPLILASADHCTPLDGGMVLSKYFLKNCKACERFTPIFDEIKKHAEKAQINLKFREIDCDTCECNGVASFPTIELTNDKTTKATAVGYKDYQSLSKWLNDALGTEKDLFADHISHVEGEVKNLVSTDFLDGFDGQWLILFYSNKHDPWRAIFKEVSRAYKNKITVAEATSKEAASVAARYNIKEYPYVMAINNGTPVPYTGTANFASIAAFAEKLYLPAFEEITYNGLRNLTKGYVKGEPIYVVLYKNFEMASFYFNELAQQFKFKAKIYRSSDPEMFAAAGYHPKDLSDFDKNPDHNQMVHLAVYKNSTFFVSPAKLDSTNEIIEWIFHTHFPHVTEVNNDNFYTVFHGIKPVVLLLTRGDDLLESFNRISATWHLGAAATNLIFASLDTVEYPVFKEHVLQNVAEPSIAFYDPVIAQWYHKAVKLNSDNLGKIVMKMIDLYFNKKLPVYPKRKRTYSFYAYGTLIIMAMVLVYKIRLLRRKVD